MAETSLNVPPEFRQYVDRVLAAEAMGGIVGELFWGKTSLDQCFVLVTSKVLWYAVRLIIDEDHRNLDLVISHNVHNDDVVLRKEFLTSKDAGQFVEEMRMKLENGSFDETSVRIRKLPPDVFHVPDKFLEPGDHIQRNELEGVYLGRCQVAYVNGESDATARIDSFEAFAKNKSNEIRVLVYCLRHRTRHDICEVARRLTNREFRPGERNLLRQHFASLCVIGKEGMPESKGVLLGVGITAGAVALVSALYAAASALGIRDG